MTAMMIPTIVPTLEAGVSLAGQISSEKEEIAVTQVDSTVSVSDWTVTAGPVLTQVWMLATMSSLVDGTTV